MGKLLIVQVDKANRDLHERLYSKDEKFIGTEKANELTKKLRELLTFETGTMINVLASNYQDSDLRRIAKILKSYNFYIEHIESSIPGDKKSFLTEIRKSFANFAYTVAFTDYSTKEISKLILEDLGLRHYEQIAGPSKLLCFLAEFKKV